MVSPTRQKSGPRVDQDIEPPYSPLERIAIAFMKQDYPTEVSEDGSLTELGYLYWHRKGFYYVQDARELLRALREPSEAMTAAGAGSVAGLANWGDCDGSAPLSEYSGPTSEIWEVMIDAALEEG